MEKIIIAAIAKNFVIGKDGKMPWRISEELKHFKKTTMSYPLLMGRKTYISFGGKPLKGRLNCVLTRNREMAADYENLKIFFDFDAAVKHCEENNYEKLFIIGGAEIYNKSIEKCDRLILSFLREEYDGDTFFPEIDDEIWSIDKIEPYDKFDVHYYTRKDNRN